LDSTLSQAPASLVADSNNVYFTTVGPNGNTPVGALLQLSLAGGTPTVLNSSVHQGSLAVDQWSVYFASVASSCDAGSCAVSAVKKVPIGGGPPVTVATTPFAAYLALAVDATSVYFGTARGIFKVTPK
jgi:hypothetical protein